jgi:hypothetical protein
MSRDAVVVVVVPLEDELAHVYAVNVDYGLDAVVLEQVTGNEVADTELLACFRLDVHYLGLEISIFTVVQFRDGAIVDKDGRLEVREERMRGHDKAVPSDRG